MTAKADDFDTKSVIALSKARERRFAAHWYGCDESEIVEVKMRVPTREELEERVAGYLRDLRHVDLGLPEEVEYAAKELVKIFNQWTVEVIAPEALESGRMSVEDSQI